jgi:hypothetical protein
MSTEIHAIDLATWGCRYDDVKAGVLVLTAGAGFDQVPTCGRRRQHAVAAFAARSTSQSREQKMTEPWWVGLLESSCSWSFHPCKPACAHSTLTAHRDRGEPSAGIVMASIRPRRHDRLQLDPPAESERRLSQLDNPAPREATKST